MSEPASPSKRVVENWLRAAARQRALSRLARMYPTTYEVLYGEELRRGKRGKS